MFCLMLFLATYSIISNTVVLIGTPFGERLFYLPSVGLCMLLACAITALHDRLQPAGAKGVQIMIAVFAMVCLLFAARTIDRNRDWKSDFVLYANDVRVTPTNAKIHLKLGYNYLERKEHDVALAHFDKAIAVYPTCSRGFIGKADVYAKLNQPKGNYRHSFGRTK